MSVGDICDMNGRWITPARCWYLGFLTTYPGTTLAPEPRPESPDVPRERFFCAFPSLL